MQKYSFTDFDRPYRRGVVLGLSLAELFIILSFLLLLAMIGYSASREQELEEYKGELAEQGTRLARAEVQNVKDRETIDALRDNLATTLDEVEQAQQEAEDAEKRAEAAEEKLGNIIQDDDPNDLINKPNEDAKNSDIEAGIQDAQTEAAHTAEIGKQIQEKANERGVSPSELIATIEKTPALQSRISELEKQIETLKGVITQKGQDSPCWYKMAKRSNGEDYERPLYIFDIRISDRYIFVKDTPAPTLKYQKQKETLEFDRAALNRNLNYAEFTPAFQPFKLAGHNKKIRNDRRCTFYVSVWDATSKTNKPGYKRAHNEIVQGIFNTYEPKEDPWPH